MINIIPSFKDVLSHILEEIMSNVREKNQERKQQRELEEELRKGIGYILDSEKGNPYFNELSVLIYNSRIIADIVNRYSSGEVKLDYNQRIDDYVQNKNYKLEQIKYFKSVYKKISECIENILISKLDSSDKVILHEFRTELGNVREDIKRLSQLTPVMIEKKNEDTAISISSLKGQDKPSLLGVPIIVRNAVFFESDDEKCEGAFALSELLKYKHIILTGDAGCGKSFAMYQLYDEAVASGSHVIYYALPFITSTNSLDVILKEKVEINQQTIILLDGYDELSEEKKNDIVKKTTGIIEKYPNIIIVIASRGNAIDESISNRVFSICKLLPLEKENIIDYLNQNDIDSDSFINQVTNQELSDVCSIPFYLQELISLWKQDEMLPSRFDLMKTIVHSRLCSDAERYSKIQIRIKQKIMLQTKYLELIALVMQCVQRQIICHDEIGQIIKPEESMIEYYSVCEKVSESEWRFSHNIFREYFAARALCKFDLQRIFDFICNPYDKTRIRCSWYNVLAFLLSECYMSDQTRYERLLEWLIKNDVNALIFCESDKINDKIRTSVFKHLLEECKSQNAWIDHNLFLDSHFSLFACTPETIDYILDEITLSISVKQTQNLLRCLAYFDQAKHYDARVVEMISSIVFDSTADVRIRTDALNVMTKHANDFAGFEKNMADLFCKESDAYIRYRIVQFWKSVECCEDYFDLILSEYKDFSQISENYSYQNLIINIISDMKSVNSAEILLHFLISNHTASFNLIRLNVVSKCCSIGIEAYRNGLKNQICDLLLQYINNSVSVSDDDYSAIKQYMIETNSENVFFKSVLLNSPNAYSANILGHLMCDAFLDCINLELQNKEMDLNIVRRIAQNENIDITYRRKLAQIYYSHCNVLLNFESDSSIEEERKASYTKYIEALFNRELYVDLVKCVLEILGEDATVGKEVKFSDYDNNSQIYAKPELRYCWLDLRSISHNEEKIGLLDCLKKIKNWDIFRIQCLNRIMENNSSIICLSDLQREIVEKQVLSILQSTDYNSITVNENTVTYPALLPDCLRAMRLFGFKCSSELGVKLITVPLILFDDRNHYDTFPSWVLDSVDSSVVSELITKTIIEKKLNSLIAPTYIKYCTDNNLKECKNSIIELILYSEYNNGFYSYGIEYISKLFGVGVLLSEVVPFCVDDKVLLNVASYIPIDVPSDELEEKLWNIYNKTKDIDCLRRLIARSNCNAIEEYYLLAKANMTLPDDVPEPEVPALTDAISHISNPQCADVLIKLLLLANDKQFKDRKDFGLKYYSVSTLRNIARSNGEEVIAKLEQNITHDNSDSDVAINELLRSINADLINSSDTPISFEQALILIS